MNSSIQQYNLQGLCNGSSASPVREHKGHLNERNFVGMAVNSAGYVFTGSETNEVVMYHSSAPGALVKREIKGTDVLAGMDGKGGEQPIASCVAVGQAGDVVVAGGTTGWVNAMRLV